MEVDRYRHFLFFMVWFFLLSLYTVIALRNEVHTLTFKVGLFMLLITLIGIIELAAKIRAKIKREI